MVAPVGSVPKKQQIRLSPLRPGRRVRWTFEVSADVDAENRARVKKPAKKRKRTKSIAKLASPSSLPHLRAANDAQSTSTPVAAPVMQATPPWQPTGRQLGVLAGAAVLVIATVAVPRWPPAGDTPRSQQLTERRESAVHLHNPSPTSAAPAPRAAMAARPVVKTRALTEAQKKRSVQNATNRTAEPTKPASPVAAKDNAPTTTGSTTKPALPEPMPTTPASTSGDSLSPVTITGCLEISTDGNEFRLADTEGPDAPKSRNWRTGFLKKRTAPVALAGAPDAFALKTSIGKRVAATGLLTARELQVSSLHVVSSFCN